VATTPQGGAKAAETWAKWRPQFSDYEVLVMNYTGDRWPEATRADFEKYVRGGGGLVIVHAADNAFPDWPEFNEMIAVGGWGGRNEKSGPMVRWREGRVVLDTTPGAGGTHGPQHEFVVETRAPEHPIMRGLPGKWRHASDELYSKLRGPAKNLTVLATTYAAPDKGGTGENEPTLMTIAYGQGRVFHTVLGHGPAQMNGLGFQVTLLRGAEWAATGKVTLPAPKPEELTADKAAVRPMPKKN
jgi:type 1 glutamine amidotransferase